MFRRIGEKFSDWGAAFANQQLPALAEVFLEYIKTTGMAGSWPTFYFDRGEAFAAFDHEIYFVRTIAPVVKLTIGISRIMQVCAYGTLY